MKGTLIGSITVFVLPVLAHAEPLEYTLDRGHSRIFFDVNHQGYSMMRGMFRDFDGTLLYDADDPSASSVNITVDAASVDMFHDGLNNHLQNDDFFGVQSHPALTFSSTEIEDQGNGQLRVHGDLTLLGVSNPVTLEASHNQTGEVRGGATKVGFSASGNLDRTDYGMNFGVPVLGADVAFDIQIEATRGGGAPGGMGMGMGQ